AAVAVGAEPHQRPARTHEHASTVLRHHGALSVEHRDRLTSGVTRRAVLGGQLTLGRQLAAGRKLALLDAQPQVIGYATAREPPVWGCLIAHSRCCLSVSGGSRSPA